MGNNVPMWVLVAVALATTILTTGLQIFIQGRRDARVNKRVKVEREGITTSLEAIHGLVDGTNTELRTRNAELEKYNKQLEQILVRQAGTVEHTVKQQEQPPLLDAK